MKNLYRPNVRGKVTAFLVIFFIIAYSSCRKSDDQVPSSTRTNAGSPASRTLGAKIAANLAHSLTGNYGGVNLMDGMDSLSLGNHLGPHHGASSNLLCGLFTDSLVNRNSQEGDTSSHTGGNLTFYFNCQNGKPSGYTAYDSLGTTRTTPQGLFQNYYVKQYYTIKCLDNKHLFIDVNGDNYFYQLVNLHCTCTGSTFADVENANYVLTDLTVDICHKDILSGTATFQAYGEGWHVSGSITFLGHHMADVLINGVTYHVNLTPYIF